MSQTMRFANALRAQPGALVLSEAADAWTLRVQAAEAWDAVRVVCTPQHTVAQLKQAAMAVLLPDVTAPDDYCVKLHGALIDRESDTLSAVGARDASTLFITSRRRRPIL